MDYTIGNQQATLFLSWLAGFIDADGCISANVHTRRGNKPQITLKIVIEVGDEKIIHYISDHLKDMNIAHWVSETRMKNKSGFVPRKPITTFAMSGMKRIKPFLELIIPYLVLKKEEAILMKEFIDSRLPKSTRDDYSRHEIDLLKQIIQLKKSGRLRDYTRRHLPKVQDIVRSSAKSEVNIP